MTALLALPAGALQRIIRCRKPLFSDPTRFRQSLDDLPSLGNVEDNHDWSKKLAKAAKSIAEANESSSGRTLGGEAGQWALTDCATKWRRGLR
ncbi:hypothetical protein WDV93_14390 [Pantoea ananatis]